MPGSTGPMVSPRGLIPGTLSATSSGPHPGPLAWWAGGSGCAVLGSEGSLGGHG